MCYVGNVRGIDMNVKKRNIKNKYSFKIIGCPPEKTNERLLKIYQKLVKIRHGKSIKEIVDQVNTPRDLHHKSK